VSAWAHTSQSGRVVNVFFTCSRHSGTTKAAITKGSYTGRGVVPFDVSVGTVAADPEAAMRTLEAQLRADKAAKEADQKARALHYSQLYWETKRADYNSDRDVQKAAGLVSRSGVTDDEWGRVFVSVSALRMTPKVARALAQELLAAADAAWLETEKQVKPMMAAERAVDAHFDRGCRL
jgi:hypothetical protein